MSLPAAPHHYRRRPETTVLHAVVSEHLPALLRDADERFPFGYPRHIEKTFRAYLRCGLLTHGFVRVRCDACGDEALVAFSCKRRGVCPSCQTRRMSEAAAHLVDRVLPPAPYRQWTIVVPHRFRLAMAAQPAMLSAVLTALMQELFKYQRRVARRMSETSPKPGAIAFVQRFGSSLNLHPHIHAIVPDVVFMRADTGQLAQIPIPPPSPGDLAQLARHMAIRVHRLFERASQRGPLAELAARAGDDDEQAALTASLAEAMPRQFVFDAGDSPEAKQPTARQQTDAAYVGGVSLHISKAIPTSKCARLERLLRYGARPPLASSRLTQTPSGKVAYELRRPSHTGQTHVVLAPVAFLRRLAALMPPPRVHMLRFFGVFAPRHAFRNEIAALAARAADAPARVEATQPQPARNSAPARYRWAQLLARVFAADLTRCQRPDCAGKVRVIAEIIDPDVIAKILSHLGLHDVASAPPPARAPPPAPSWAWASP